MPLSNSQYDEIMREYDRRRIHNQHLTSERIDHAYRQVPRLKEIDSAIAQASVKQAGKLLSGDSSALSSLKQQIADYRKEREMLLAQNQFPEDFFKPIYTCPDCRDTAYINGEK